MLGRTRLDASRAFGHVRGHWRAQCPAAFASAGFRQQGSPKVFRHDSPSKTTPASKATIHMPNIGSILRDEITRLSRKVHRGQSAAVQKAGAQHRRDIAALKRQVALLERQVAALSRRGDRGKAAVPANAESKDNLRFVAKGLKSHRARLGLSAGEFGQLVGASANSVYAWESGKTVPRKGQLAKIAAVRVMGKRDARRLLDGGAAKKRRA